MNDLTRHVETNLFLTTSLTNLEEDYDSSPCGLMSVSMDGTIVKINQTFLNSIQHKRESLIHQKRIQDLLSSGGKVFFETHWLPLLLIRGYANEIAADVLCKDGSELPFIFNSTLVKDSEGIPIEIRFGMLDVSERRRYEKLLLKKEHDLRDQEMVLKIAGRMARVGAWTLNIDTQRVIWSDEAALIHGKEPGFSPTLSEAILFYAPESQPKIQKIAKDALTNGNPFDAELTIITNQGERVWVRVIGEAVRDVSGKIVQMRGAINDISYYRKSEQQVNCLADRLTTTLETITDAFYTVDCEWKFTYLNKEAERVLRCTRDQVIGMVIWDAFNLAANTKIYVEYHRAVNDQCKVTFEEYYAPLSTWFEISAYPSDEGLAVYFRDISERKRSEAEIQNLAFYDPLTGLPNRRLLMDRLNHALAVRNRNKNNGALFLIDLDNFKTLNDSLGHASGDLILQQVGKRLLSCVRSCDTVARLGGDEFVVLVGQLNDNQHAAAAEANVIGGKLVACLNKPYSYNTQHYHLSASIGISLFTERHDSASEALRRADIAMYQAKASGRNSAQFFDHKMQALIDERASIEADLWKGIELGQFELYYQPQLDADERVIGVEALMRWHHPERGMISPAHFIPLAEETGLMVPLGDWAMNKACRQIASWKNNSLFSSIPIAVNISAVQTRQNDFVEKVIQAITDADIPPELMKLELTESLLIDDIETTIAKMNELKNIGVKFSLDDFGTGYSSLSYLKRLPLESLKIDQSFVRDVLEDPNDAAIAGAIVSMARSLGLAVIAEGVETMAHKDKLLELGCNYYQGYAFSKPIPISQLEEYLQLKNNVN